MDFMIAGGYPELVRYNRWVGAIIRAMSCLVRPQDSAVVAVFRDAELSTHFARFTIEGGTLDDYGPAQWYVNHMMN